MATGTRDEMNVVFTTRIGIGCLHFAHIQFTVL